MMSENLLNCSSVLNTSMSRHCLPPSDVNFKTPSRSAMPFAKSANEI